MKQKSKRFGRLCSVLLSFAMIAGMAPAQVFAEEAPTYAFGPDSTVLSPGSYDLPVRLVQDTNHAKDSMAGSCVEGAVLTVDEDGTADVTVELGSVTVGSLTAWASDWKIYNKYWDSSDDEDFCDEQYLQDCAFTTTETNGKTVVNSITFDVLFPEKDGIYTQMFVDIMQASPSAYFKFSYAGAQKLEDPSDKPQFAFGSKGTMLSVGSYEVPIALKNASHPENASAAASAFPAMADLTIRENGTAVITTDINEVTVGPISDRAYNISIHKAYDDTSEVYPADVLEEIPKDEDMMNPGKMVPSKISFAVPDASFDGVYMRFTVDAMGSSPDALLLIDYPHAAKPSESRIYEGINEVFQFGQYDVHVKVTVTNGVIENVDIRADRFTDDEAIASKNKTKVALVTTALQHAWDGLEPTQENAEAIYTVIEKPEVADSVSGATYSAKGVRDAIMNAFNLYYEKPIQVPESVAPGTYEVDIAYYAEVGHHSLVENDTAKAQIAVSENGHMQLDLNPVSGTEKEPMYIMSLNGYYPANDRTKKISMKNCSQVKEDIQYEDENFPEDTQVVTHISFPMEGPLTKIYYTNMYLYVPAMKNLNGNLHNVFFDNGRFDTDICAKIYWDTLTRTGEAPDHEEEAVKPHKPSGGGGGGGGSIIKPEKPVEPPIAPPESIEQPEVIEPVQPAVFTDITNHWAKEHINKVVQAGLFAGTTKTTFSPDLAMNRGMFVKVLAALNGADLSKYQTSAFKDIAADDYYSAAAAWASENGIVFGTGDGAFSPKQNITRQDMAVMMVRYAEKFGIELKADESMKFADEAMIADYAKEAVNTVSAAGLMVGMDENNFSPKTDVTRAQGAAILSRFMTDYAK